MLALFLMNSTSTAFVTDYIAASTLNTALMGHYYCSHCATTYIEPYDLCLVHLEQDSFVILVEFKDNVQTYLWFLQENLDLIPQQVILIKTTRTLFPSFFSN